MNIANQSYHFGEMEGSVFQNTSGNVTYSIDILNDRIALTRLGGMIFVGILMIVGLIGNAHALYIYKYKFRSSNRRIFILSLASLDLSTCFIGMPFVIADLRNPLKFDNAVLCKSFRFLSYIMSVGSICILVAIALDRYQKICRPMKKSFTTRQSKIACMISLLIAVAVSWPAFVLYGRSTFKIKSINFKGGITCFTEDQYKNTNYQIYFMGALFLLAVLAGSALIFLYTRIRKTISKQTKSRQFMTKLHCKCASLPRNKRLTLEPGSPLSECCMEDCEFSENDSSNDLPYTTTNATNSCDDSFGIHCKNEVDMIDINSTYHFSTFLSIAKGSDKQVSHGSGNLNGITKLTSDLKEDVPLHKNTIETNIEQEDSIAPVNNILESSVLHTPTSDTQHSLDRTQSSSDLLSHQPTTGLETKWKISPSCKHMFIAITSKGKIFKSKHQKDEDKKGGQVHQNAPVLGTRKINFMFLAITIVFFVSFIPHLGLVTIIFADEDYYLGLDFVDSFIFNTFIWTFFINNMANPLIYCFCDPKFRGELKKLYKRCSKSSNIEL